MGAFVRTSQRYPDAIALSDGERSWTFAELARASGRLAARIRDTLASVETADGGLGEPRVALLAEARAESVVAILAILEAGAAYVPLEPSHPVSRHGFQLRDAGVSLLLGSLGALDRLASQTADSGLPVLVLDREDPTSIRNTPDEPPIRSESAESPGDTSGVAAVASGPLDGEQLAYVIYTSGSTGRPKGVGVCHRTVLHLIEATRDTSPCGPGQVGTLFHSLAFDLSVWELWRPLLGGGRLVVVPESDRGRGEALLELLDRQRVSQLSLTPSALRLLIAAGFGPGHPPRLKRLFVGGEAIEVERLRPWLDGPANGLRIEALYGPTEATVWASRHPLARADLAALSNGATPLGSPIPGWTLDLDRDSGEIRLGGVALARGYFGRPALTAERFVPDPMGFGARRYRTGDRGRRRDDGLVEFLGRTDQQVKIRGFRIELGEIEAVLARHPGLREAVVVTSRDAAGEPVLVAHGVLASAEGNGDSAAGGERFRAYLGQHLPAVQVPTRVHLWSELPRLSSGKVDRRALAHRSRGWRSALRPAEGPDTAATHQVLAALWGELLGRDPETLDPEANFFALGGHSLLLTRLAARIPERLGLELDFERMLADPTLAGLRRAVVEPSAQGPRRPPNTPAESTNRPPQPTRSARRALWWAHQGAGRLPSGVLHETRGWRLVGSLDIGAWVTAWSRLVASQPALRTSFYAQGQQVLERVTPLAQGASPALLQVDLSGLDRRSRWRELEVRQRQLALAPFDIESGPLVRSVLANVAPDEHRLVVVAHHLVTDGWSDALLVRQLTQWVEQPGATPKTHSTPVRDRSEAPPGEIPSWMVAEVADLPPVRLIADRESGESHAGWAGRRRGELGAATVSRLASRAQALDTSEAVVSLALVLAFGGRLLSTDTLAIAWPTAGRSGDDTDRLGCFAELQVVRGDLLAPRRAGGGRWVSLDDLVRETRRRVLRLLGLRGIGFGHWMRAAGADRGASSEGAAQALEATSHHPLVQIVLAPQDFPVADPELAGLSIEPHHPPPTGTRFDLEILSQRRSDGALQLDWVFPRQRFDATTVERWRRGFERFVDAALEAPQRSLDISSWWSRAERHQVSVGWNDTEDRSMSPSATDEPGLFERVCRRARTLGAATAVVAERADGGVETLTWSQLVTRARDLAARLVARGVRAEEPVALLFERGVASVVAMLGVLAAGGAYLPLDPRWPRAHRQRLLRKAGVRWLLRVPRSGEVEGLAKLEGASPRQYPQPRLPVPRLPERGASRRLAYLMATSGSTGEPKLVAISQRGVSRLVLGARWVDLRDQVVFHYAPESFDASTLELWAPLLVGRRLVIAPPGPLSVVDIAHRVEQHRVTFLWLTAPLFHQVAQGPLGRFRSLSDWFAGGDVVRPAAVARIQRRLPATRVHNAYGPTENTTFSTICRVAAGADRGGRLPIGRPLTHDRLWVLDPRLEPLPPGVPGELGVSGPGLARGYHGNPRGTAERFVPHPCPRWAGERLYRTGDRGRWLADGGLDFLGRFDRQLKIRGVRVEPVATEEALAELPEVESVAVVVVRGADGAASLGAAVVPRGQPTEGWLEALARRARAVLPEAQLPSRWRVVDRLPTTVSEKIDRQKLARFLAESSEATIGRPPRGPWEEAMAEVWSKILGVAVGAEHTFFELGGDSLRITHLAAEIQRRWGIELPLRQLFENPTLAELAKELAVRVPLPRGARLLLPGVDDPGAVSEPPEPSIGASGGAVPAVRNDDDGPTTWAQRRLWAVARVAPEDPTDVVPIGWWVSGPLDVRVLRWALADLVRRHEGLRSRLVERQGEPWQRVASVVTLPCLEVDLSGLGMERGRRLADRLAFEGARRVFDLSRVPLWRMTVVRLGRRRHLLLFEAHHALVDGAALALFCRDLGRAWADRFRGSAVSERSRPERSRPERSSAPSPRAAAREQRRRWEGSRGPLEAYWRERLAGLAPAGLPTDRAPGGASGRGKPSGQIAWVLDRDTGSRLRRLASDCGATVWTALLAVHSLLLERLGADPSSALASPEAGREGASGVLACFAELMVFRRSPREPRESFRHFLATTRRDTRRDLDHRGIPFDHLLSPDLGLVEGFDRRRHPLAQVSVAVHPGEVADLALEGLRVERRPIVGESTHLDLEIHLWPRPEGRFEGYGTYRSDLFDRTTVERWSRLFATLARQWVEAPDRPIEECDGLGLAARHQLLVEWNDRRRDLGAEGEARGDAGETLHGLVRRRLASRRRHTVMVGPGGDRWSGARLLDRAAALARVLRRHGVGPESVVAVELPRGPRQLVAFLAVLEAGGVYLPLDPDHPEAHRRSVLVRAAVGVQVGAVEARPASPCPAEIWLGIDGEGVGSASQAGRTRPRRSPPGPLSRGREMGKRRSSRGESAAYVLFTSGSSGRPKGVVVSHRAIVHHMRWIEETLPLGPEDRLLQKTPAVFDASVWEHWLPLMTGARQVMAPPGIERDPDAFVEALETHRITVIQVVPTQLRLLLTVPGFARCRSLRRVVCGGEALPRELVQAFRRGGPPARLVNVYGPTEATIHATWEPRPEEEGRPLAAIGRPLANTAVWVVDRFQRPAPPGVVGRLLVSGPGLARGYLADPRATAEVFRPAPWSGPRAQAGDRVYDTGDLGRWLADGRLEWVGRADRQVKWRGVRLEPGEVEAALVGEPEVQQAVVDVVADQGGPGQLVAWLVPTERERPPSSELVRRLRRRLPGGWVPSRWHWLGRLPRTAGGKVDRRRLVESTARSVPSAGHGVPEDGLAGEVARLWSEVLGHSGPIEAQVGFFEQGGHSLLATQLLARVRRLFGVDLGLAEFFARPTLTELVEAIRQGRRRPSVQPPPLELGRPEPEGPWPVSLAQRRLWFLHRLEPASTAYTMPAAWRIRGPLDPEALEQAFVRLLARHPALGTRFPERNGLPCQEFAELDGTTLPRIDLRRRPEGLEALLWHWTRRTFDLPAGPPWRAALARTGRDEHWLLINVHHIVYDGWSASRVVAELGALYGSVRDGARPALEPAGPTPAVIALAQAPWLDHPSLARQREYWRGQLAGLPALELPLDRPRERSARRRRAAGLDLSWHGLGEPISHLSRRLGVTPFMVLLATQAAVLQHWGAGDDLAIGSPVAGRRQPELEGVVGFFVNLLVLRLQPRTRQRFDELLATTREVALSAYDHQELPFERVVEDLAPERRDERNPLVSVSLAFQNVPRRDLQFTGCRVEARALEPPETRFDLEAYFWLAPRGLEGRLVFCRDLFDATTLQRFAERWHRVLVAVGEDPGRQLDRLPWLSRGECHQMLIEWGGPTAARPADEVSSVVRRVLAQASDRPEAVAVRGPGSKAPWTYARLVRRAAWLAARLEALGIRPEERVALWLEPGAELVAAMLGVMAAGATQVPLDPSHPPQRLAYVLADAKASLLVCPPGGAPSVATGPVLELEPELASAVAEGVPSTWSPRRVDGAQLAYVIYTSGSTGRPKGVGVSHHALARLSDAVGGPFDPGPDDVWSLFHSAAFDFSVWEIWGALADGGTLAVIGAEERRDPERVVAALAAHGVTVLDLTPSALRWLCAAGGARRWPRSLRWVLFGGEALDPALLAPFFDSREDPRDRRGGPRWANLYGITETTVHATWHLLESVDVEQSRRRRGSPIGRPLGDLVARVLAKDGASVPLGAEGELWIGGPGVARGYLGQPALTAERFRPDPQVSNLGVPAPGARLYRSGDRVRWRADGTLEYLGRFDDQVQLRGHRVEPGEVAARLLDEDGVAAAAVVVLGNDGANRLDPAGPEPRLAAGLVPARGAVAATPVDGSERVRRWRQVYDSLYREDRVAPLGFDTRGWTSGITGEPFSEAAMASWRDRLLRRLLRSKPGDGSPWRVWEIGCGSGMLLHGLAPQADLYLATDLSAPTLDRLSREVAERGLSRVELEQRSADDFTGRETPSFDLVILSSVIQYFHGGEQLATVLRGALRALVPGGRLFLGDVRNLAAFGVYRRQIEAARGVTAASHLEVGGSGLRAGDQEALRGEHELLVHPALFAALPRHWPEVASVEILPRRGSRELERHRYDVVLRRSPRPSDPGARRLLEPWVNDPLAEERHRAWCDTLRRRLASRLPSYLVPAVVETVDTLPRTANGKIDRRALIRRLEASAPEVAERTATSLPVGDGSPLEGEMLALWSEVLGRPAGLDDDFFDLGGHSLLATRLVARLRDRSRREVPLAWLFEARTVRALAARLDHAPTVGATTLVRRAPADPGDTEEIPLAPPQERLWFVEQLEPGGGAYAMPAAWRIRGRLRVGILSHALDGLVRRHHSLRAAVVGGREGPILRIPPVTASAPGLRVVDLRSLGAGACEQSRCWLTRLAHRPFVLEDGGLLRVVLFRLGEDEAVLGFFTHHLVFDGVSETLVLRELAERYAAAFEGRTPKIEAGGLEYADYALWQRRGADPGDRRRRGLEFWRHRLADAPRLELPTDHPRASPRRSRGRSFWRPLPPSVMAGLDALARRAGQSRFVLALSAFFVFLVRWTGQHDLVVGTPVANRGHRELEGIVGCFVNTVAIRPRHLDPRESFAALASRVGGFLSDALEHQDVPFAELVAALDPQRDSTRLPVVEAVLGLATAAEGRLELGDCATESLAVDLRRTPFDLMVTLREREGEVPSVSGWGVEWRHAADLFDPTTVRRQVEAFLRILSTAAENPDQAWGSASPLTVGEQHQLLVEWTQGDPAPSEPATNGRPHAPAQAAGWLNTLLVDLEQRGPVPALRCRGREVSAAELATRVLRFAEGLASELAGSELTGSELTGSDLAGADLAGAEPRVAVLLDRSPEWVEIVLGILAAGGVVVPLDPDHPPERQGDQLATVDPVGVVGGDPARRLAESLGVRWLDPRALATPRTDDAGRATLVVPQPEALAQLIFTSGSTGRPKAVAVTHRGLGCYLDSARRRYPWSGRGVPFFTSVAVDLTVTGWLLPLVVGEPVEIVPAAVTDPATLQTLQRPGGWSLVKLTPSHLELLDLAAGGPAADPAPTRLPRVGALVVGGEPLSVDRVRRARRRFPGVRVFNEYGPTETTVGSTVETVPCDRELAAEREVSIGRPWETERVVLLDRAMRPVPLGVVGELFIGGAGLARGYWGRPSRTARAFVPDPTPSASPGARLYATGDLAHWNAVGALELRGRRDAQLTVRGHRVEPGEIEATFETCPGVARAVVVPRGGGLAVALVASEGVARHDEAAVRRDVAQRLPQAWIPGTWRWLEALTLAPSGKVDRRAVGEVLRDPEGPRKSSGPRPDPGQDALVEEIRAIWAAVLAQEHDAAINGKTDLARPHPRDLPVDRDFFALGGHSLAALRLIHRLRGALGLEVPLHRLLAGVTILDLASWRNPTTDDASSAPRRRRPGVWEPLSAAQNRCFHRAIPVDHPGLHVVWVRRLRGPFDRAAVATALRRTTRRHETFATVFDRGQRRQRVVPRVEVEWTWLDGRSLASEPETVLDRLRPRLRRWSEARFDLEQRPAVRWLGVALGADDHLLALTIHHLLIDGMSLAVLEDELASVYRSARAGRECPTDDPATLQPIDVARDERRRTQPPANHAHEKATGSGPLDWVWPGEVVETSRSSERATEIRTSTLGGETQERLFDRAHRAGTTLLTLLLAALARTLAQILERESMALGTVVSNRQRRGLDRAIGFLAEVPVLEVDFAEVTADAPPEAHCSRARRALVEALSRLDEGATRGLAVDRARCCPVVLNLVAAPGRESLADWGDLRVSAIDLERSIHAIRDVTVYAVAGDDGLELSTVSDARRVPSATADRLHRALGQRLESWSRG